MKPSAIRARIINDTTELAQILTRVRKAGIDRDAGTITYEEWLSATAELRHRYNTLAFPGGYQEALEKFKVSDESVIEPALCFLEVRPYFHRSGYMISTLMRRVKRSPLSPSQRDRLDAVISRNLAWKRRKGRSETT